MTKGLKHALYVGEGLVRGVKCHHLAFDKDDIQWQIWIDAGEKPLIRKLLINQKKLPAEPQWTAYLTDWNFSPQLSDNLFAFTPPEKATKTKFVSLKEAARRKRKRPLRRKRRKEISHETEPDQDISGDSVERRLDAALPLPRQAQARGFRRWRRWLWRLPWRRWRWRRLRRRRFSWWGRRRRRSGGPGHGAGGVGGPGYGRGGVGGPGYGAGGVGGPGYGDVDVSRNVNVSGGWGYYGGGGAAAGAVAGAAAGLAIGATIASLPAAAQPLYVNNQNYYYDGTNYYQPCAQGSDMNYCVVSDPKSVGQKGFTKLLEVGLM